MPTTVLTFATDEVDMVFKEPTVTDGLNEKLLFLPAGVYLGFEIQPDAVALQVKVVPAGNKSDHRATVETINDYSLSIRRENQFTISLVAFTTLTVYIAIKGTYTTAGATVAVINVYTAVEYAALTTSQQQELVILARVVVPAAGLIPAGNIDYSVRTLPIWGESSNVRPWVQAVRNGGFELGSGAMPGGMTFWNGGTLLSSVAIFRIIDTDPFTGTQHLELFYDGAGTQNVDLAQPIGMPVAINAGLRIKVRYKRITTALSGSLVFTLFGLDDAAVQTTLWTATVDLTAAPDGAYQTIEVMVSTGELVSRLDQFLIQAVDVELGAPLQSVVYVDDIEVLAQPFDATVQPYPIDEASTRQAHTSAIYFQSSILRALTDPYLTPAGNLLTLRNNSVSTPADFAVGGTVSPGALLLTTLAQTALPRVRTTRAPVGLSQRTLLWLADGLGGDAISIYHRVTNSGGHDREAFELGLNAQWDGAQFVKGNTSTPAHLLRLDQADFRIDRRDGSSPFVTFDSSPVVLPLTVVSNDQAGVYTGRVTVGSALLANSTQALKPRLTAASALAATSERTLIAEFPSGDANAPAFRLYRARVSSLERFELVLNAVWDGAQWTREFAGTASVRKLLRADLSVFEYHAAASASPWADASWVTTTGDTQIQHFPGTLRLSLRDTTTRITSPTTVSNPAGLASSVDPNTLYAKNLPKVWGSIETTGGSAGTFAVSEGFGIASVAFIGGNTGIDVTMANAMVSTAYAVMVSGFSSTGAARTFNVAANSTTVFRITVADPAGVGVDIDLTKHTLYFCVFGQQNG